MKVSGTTPARSPSSRTADRGELLLARFLFGVGGFFAGSILGIIASFLVLDLLSQGNDLLVGFGMIVALPLSLLAAGIPGVRLGLRLLRYLTRPLLQEREQKVRLRVVAGLLVGYPAVIAALAAGIACCETPPSDRAMLAEFARHRQDLDRAVAMLHEDRGLKDVNNTWTTPDNPATVGVSPDRLAEYRRLLRGIGPRVSIIVRSHPAQIEFIYWGRGSAVSSDRFKGYAYLTAPPAPAQVLDDLDDGAFFGGFCRYRHIVGNWYLYRMYIPG